MESMHSMSEILFNQVEQIADVKTCNVDNVEQKYYKIQWKCTWEPATVLERFCGKLIADYNKHPKQQPETVDKTQHHDKTENNVSINLKENSVVNVNTDIAKEDSQFASNLFNKEPSKICSINEDVLNENLSFNCYSVGNNLTQQKPDNVNNLTLMNLTIKPDPNQELFPNINVLCESKHTTEKESTSTNKDQNNGSLSTLDSAELITKPCKKLSSNISKNTAANSNKRRKRTNKCYNCQLCSFSSPHNSHLRRHMRKHTGEKPFKCQLCSFSTSRKSSIKCHMLVHTGEKPFKCQLCSFTTSHKGNIKTHNRVVHTDEKPFKCSICSFSTSLKGNLKTHMPKHTGEYPFNCNLCSYSTSRKHLLKGHHISKHADQALSYTKREIAS